MLAGVWGCGTGGWGSSKVTRLLYLGLLPLGYMINWLILCEVFFNIFSKHLLEHLHCAKNMDVYLGSPGVHECGISSDRFLGFTEQMPDLSFDCIHFKVALLNKHIGSHM